MTIKSLLTLCRVCKDELTTENWSPSHRKNNSRICKNCYSIKNRKYNKKNQEKIREHQKMLYYKDKEERIKYQSNYVSDHKKIIETYQKDYVMNHRQQMFCVKCGCEIFGRGKIHCDDCRPPHDWRQDYTTESLNDWFPGSNEHHITKELTIHIPAELHRHYYPHCEESGFNMLEVNTAALQFLCGEYAN